MTSNQVAYASVQVSQQVADETKRHNVATEEETNRHNKATESIQTQSNELSQLQINNENSWRTTKNGLDAEYNTIMRDYYAASLEEKEEYDRRLNDINQQRANNDYWYEQAQIHESEQNRIISALEQSEKERHNKEVERLNAWSNQISELGVSIESRRVDYQARQWETENWLSFERYGLQMQELGIKEQVAQNNYELGLMNAELQGASNLLRSRELDIKQQQQDLNQLQFEFYKTEGTHRIISNYLSAFNQSNNNAIKILDLFNPF